MSKCSADETPVCCCMDVGTIMDNSDCTASYSRVFANRADAEETLAALTEKARGVESEPCKITADFKDVEAAGYRLCLCLRSRNPDFPVGPALIASATTSLFTPPLPMQWGRFLFCSVCFSSHFFLSLIG